jgi:uncharacterized SAM-binding protein YcdF (DUF218 family)
MRAGGSPGRAQTIAGLWRIGLVLGIGVLAAGLIGFLMFVGGLDRQGGRAPPHAGAIVALTGGADRIEAALSLLQSGHGKRLLISGVSALTAIDDLKRRWPQHEARFACCVDLDYLAKNTFENALESGHWATDRGFNSLIVVTASYHLPRSMLEFETMLPGVALHAFAVVPEPLRRGEWWRDPQFVRLLVVEYVKYGAAILRTSLRIPGR